jgi:hypothetical protein
MTATITVSGWPNNMSPDDRKRFLLEQIDDWCHGKRVQDVLSPGQLGDLSLGNKYHAYKNAIVRASIWHCRRNPRADARIPIFNIITFLTDNGQGLCHLSIVKWMALLKRSRECIIDNLKGLESDSLILVYRVNGMPNSYTITYPVGLAEIGPNVTQIIKAFLEPAKPRSWTNVNEAIGDATNRSTLPDRSSLPDRSTLTPEPVYSKPATGLVESSSISSLDIFSPPQVVSASETVDTTKPGGSDCSPGSPSASPSASQRKDASPIEPPAKAGSGGIDPVELQFEEFWAAFPGGRKKGKGDALDLFRQIVTGKHKKRRASAATLVDAAKRYAATKPDPKYTPMPTTWLNGGRWMDDLSDQPKRGSKYDAF